MRLRLCEDRLAVQARAVSWGPLCCGHPQPQGAPPPSWILGAVREAGPGSGACSADIPSQGRQLWLTVAEQTAQALFPFLARPPLLQRSGRWGPGDTLGTHKAAFWKSVP